MEVVITIRPEIQPVIEEAANQSGLGITDFIEELVEKAISELPKKSPSLMSRLKRIKIDAPADVATNLDMYLSGEKHVE